MCVLRLRLAREWLDKQGWGRRMQESVAETATLRSWLVSMRVKGRPLKRISRLFYGSAVLTGRGDSASRRTCNPPLQRHRFRSSIVLMRRRHAGCAPAVCAAVPARKGPRSRTSAGESLSSLGRSGAGSQRVEVTLLLVARTLLPVRRPSSFSSCVGKDVGMHKQERDFRVRTARGKS